MAFHWHCVCDTAIVKSKTTTLSMRPVCLSTLGSLASFLNAIANVCMYLILRSQEYILNLELSFPSIERGVEHYDYHNRSCLSRPVSYGYYLTYLSNGAVVVHRYPPTNLSDDSSRQGKVQ